MTGSRIERARSHSRAIFMITVSSVPGRLVGIARLIAYDLLGLDGEDLRKLPLHERRRWLEALLSGNDVVRFSGHVEDRKGAALALEGIVSRIRRP